MRQKTQETIEVFNASGRVAAVPLYVRRVPSLTDNTVGPVAAVKVDVVSVEDKLYRVVDSPTDGARRVYLS